MSGPWDRPSGDPDRDWPAEDLDAPRRDEPPAARDPWAAGDPWAKPSANAGPGWDDWPPPPPPLEDYVVDDPEPPSSDPWAESWTDDADVPPPPSSMWSGERAAHEPPPPAPEAEEPAPGPVPPEAVEQRWSPEPPVAESQAAPAVDDSPSRPTEAGGWVARRDDALPDWLAEPIPDEPEPSPWAARPPTSDTDSHAETEPAEVERVAEYATDPLAEGDEEESEPEPLEQAVAEPELVGEAEPQADEAPAGRDVDDAAAEPDEPGRSGGWRAAMPWSSLFGDRSHAPDESEAQAAEPVAEPEIEEHLSEPAEEMDASEPDHTDGPSGGERWASAAPWSSVYTEARVEDAGEAPEEPQPGEAEPDAVAGVAPEDAAPEPETVADVDVEAEPEADAADAGEPVEPDEQERAWPSVDAWSAAAPEAVPDVAPAPPDVAPRPPGVTPPPDVTPETSWERRSWELDRAPEPPSEREEVPPVASPWPDGSDSTQVLPTSWTPPPPAPRDGNVLTPRAGDIRTSLAGTDEGLDDELDEHASTAEQAVPWLIGVILLLAGMVIVLLALIFAGPESLGAVEPSPSGSVLVALPSGSAAPVTTSTPVATPQPTAPPATPSVTPVPTPTPLPLPEYGALEMVYQGRAAALAPIYLLRHDFTTEEDPQVLAQDPNFDVRRFAWAPDGTVGAGLLSDILVSIEPGKEKRRLGEGISTITFGDDTATVYAVRVTESGANDVATVLAIDFTSGDTTELASITYPRPSLGSEAALAEAQFTDNGGAVRLYWMEKDVLRVWSLGAGSWDVHPESGEVTELPADTPTPTLWSSTGNRRIVASTKDGTTSLSLRNRTDATLASTTVEGVISHLRWSPDGERLVFTVGRSGPGGGIRQDLFLWDLEDGAAPMQMTNTGAAFGAEWLGTQPVWRD